MITFFNITGAMALRRRKRRADGGYEDTFKKIDMCRGALHEGRARGPFLDAVHPLTYRAAPAAGTTGAGCVRTARAGQPAADLISSTVLRCGMGSTAPSPVVVRAAPPRVLGRRQWGVARQQTGPEGAVERVTGARGVHPDARCAPGCGVVARVRGSAPLSPIFSATTWGPRRAKRSRPLRRLSRP